MSHRKYEYMTPRDGTTFRVLVSVRISGCTNQKEQSKEDQEQNCREHVSDYFNGAATEFTVIRCTAKGEHLDRAELKEVEAQIRTRHYDLLMVEDLGRLARDMVAKHLFGLAVDHGTRAISINDCVDTIEDSWEEDALAACADHVAHNRHVSRRIKQKSMNRFIKRGELFHQPIAGYIRYKDDGLCDMRKVPEHTDIITDGAKKMLAGASDTAVADWFNSIGFKPGPFSDTDYWKSPAVKRFYSNTILKGKPFRGARTSVKNFEKGKRKPTKSLEGPVFIDRPDLAHLDEATFDLLQDYFAERAEKYRRAQEGDDPLVGVPRTRSRYPGHCTQCWYCGSTNVWGANGVTDSLMCSGSRERTCWCSFGIDGNRLTDEVLDMIKQHLQQLPAFTEQFKAMLEEAKERRLHGPGESVGAMEKELAKIKDAQKRTCDAVALSDGIESLIEKLKSLESEEKCLKARILQARRSADQPLLVPESLEQMIEEIRTQLDNDAKTFEFAEIVKAMTKSIHTYAVRLVDSNYPEMRARIVLDLSAFWPDLKDTAQSDPLLVVTRDVPLFKPPERVQIREEAVRLREKGWKLRKIAAELNVTYPAVQQALKLHAAMGDLASPYVVVMSPSELGPKYRRHHHPKYQFTVQPGYVPSPLS